MNEKKKKEKDLKKKEDLKQKKKKKEKKIWLFSVFVCDFQFQIDHWTKSVIGLD
jgi:hypothetical protein